MLIPVRLIERNPRLFGYALETLDAKLEGLQERGFDNPIRLIEGAPSIFGLSLENIDNRIKLFDKLLSFYGLSFSASELMEKVPVLFSTKIDKIMVLVRVLREFKVPVEDLGKGLFNRLLYFNLEDVLVALKETSPESETIGDLSRRVRQVKKRKLSKKEKREMIKDDLDMVEKIKKRYFKGYPEKKGGK